MNPHRLAYGFAYSFPFAFVVAGAIFLGLLFSKQKLRLVWTRETIVLLSFTAWMFVTTFFALNSVDAWGQWDKVWKIQLMIFVMLAVLADRQQLVIMVWIIVLSLGFYGIKGGIFTIATGGNYRVWGPDGTFIGGNNELGLALIMIIPLMRFLQLSTKNKWVKLGLTGAMLLTLATIIGTQSRGALLGLVAMGLVLFLRSRKKMITAILVLGASGAIMAMMPESWFERMNTIKTYEEDASALGRINAWHFAFNLAKDRPLVGGGFETFEPRLFRQYAPNPDDYHDAHSIYFEVLGEHGFVGLTLFLLLGLFTWFTAGQTMKQVKGIDELLQARDLAAMLQVSLAGYATAGIFLGMAYFDLYYYIIALVVLNAKFAKLDLAKLKKEGK